MIKTSKKFIAIFMAAILMIAMIPFTASAATEQVSFTVNCAKDGYQFTVYQLATLDTSTGEYTMVSQDAAIASAVKAEGTSSASILSAADKATDLGTPESDVYTSNSGEKTYEVTSGIYYIKATKTPANVKSVKNTIVALPYYQDGNWVKTLGATIDLATKVNDGDVVVTKDIVDGKDGGTWTTAGLNDTVNFILGASVAGSKDMKLSQFVLSDTMSNGLTFNPESVKVTLKNETSSKDLESGEFSVINGEAPVTFTVALASSVLSSDDFYNYTDVEVSYSATLNKDAVIGATGNTNTDSLTYTNNGQTATVTGETVTVYTYGLQVEKVDANDETKKLSGAEFSIADAEGNVLATATTDTNGIGVFKKDGNDYRFNAGTYTITETKAPVGYNLNSAKIEVTIDATKTPAVTYQNVKITNTASKLPETGGIGSMMFTITGAVLIICAGVLFVIVYRKRTSK